MKENLNSTQAKWMVLDIETTGMDADYDEIIDIGFLYYEGVTCVKKYTSLVKAEVKLSPIIQKLTGISPSMVNSAPIWDVVKEEVYQFEPEFILAHNSQFEEKFLLSDWEESTSFQGGFSPNFVDTIPFLGFIFPGAGKLSLEFLLGFLGIKDFEDHRGLEDSVDLLKVVLLACYHMRQTRELTSFIEAHERELNSLSNSNDAFRFLFLEAEELLEIASSLDFPLEDHYQIFKEDYAQKNKSLGQVGSGLTKNDHYGKSHGSSLSFDGTSINQFYTAEEFLPSVVDQYKLRQSQVEFSLKVGQSLKNNIYTFIQAPTGTGKTLGYLLPVVLMLMEDPEKKAIISTGTKTLQDQIYQKDMVQLSHALGESFDSLKVVLLKGSRNHYCEVLYNSGMEDNRQKELSSEFNDEFNYTFSNLFFKFVFYLNQFSTYQNKITAEDIPYILKRINDNLSELETEIRVDTNACTYSKCPHASNCSYFNGIMEAKDAQVIIGNHALTLFWPESLDSGDYLIVDEAHKMEREVTNAFTLSVTPQDFELIKKHIFQYMGSLLYLGDHLEFIRKKAEVIREEFNNFLQRFTDNLDMLEELFESLFKKQPKYTSEYWNELPFIKKSKIKNSLENELLNKIDSIKFIFTNFFQFLTPLEEVLQKENLNDENANIAKTRFESFYGQVEKVVQVLSTCMQEEEEFFSSMKFHEEKGFSINMAPIDVGSLTYQKLLENRKSVIFSSATLANSDGSKGVNGVNWMLGLNLAAPERRFSNGLFLPPQFDYGQQAKVYLCSDVPNIWNDDYVDKIIEHSEDIINKLQGRTLFLFSSRKRFEKAVNLLFDKFEHQFPLFVQGISNNIVQDFLQSENGILVGMESLSEGIDLPGEKLKFVIIDKIPDLSMDLVVGKRRDFYQRQFGNEFIDYYLSNRCRLLQQKMGRLLRRENDSGGIIVFDPRTKNWKGRTLSEFKSLMSPYQINISPSVEAKNELLNYF